MALAAAFCGLAGGTALAGDELPAVHGTVTGFIAGMRQSVSESGASALDEAEQLLSKLDLGAGSAGDLRQGIGTLALEATNHVATRIAKIIPLGADNDVPASTAKRPARLGLQALAAATVVNGDRGWSIGHVQSNLGAEIGDEAIDPATYLTSNVNRGPVVGAALAEQSLGGHDVELGLPLPAIPEMHVTAARYWWGDRTFLQSVEGYRVGLSYDINQHLRFEGGRSEDQVHGAGGFFGLHYSVPLDTKRPPGVMPR
ncbi:MAG TPA: hypothetical protein VEU53_12815 [Stellaceae bacterium]|nr:hypothetical protein [Stellaceae bacterium]